MDDRVGQPYSRCMCGINGITRQDKELVARMNAATVHRGPDGHGVYTDEHITLGHNRLAIIDLSEKGAQPMQSADGSLVITYNGELYNYRELRSELAGYPFKSDSDTEVILAAYVRWGTACFERFNGIFALALWDMKKRELILARDQMGVKPLYYTMRGGVMSFSSEIKALLLTGIDRTLNKEAFSHFMRVTDVIGPQTLFADVQKIPPGHFAVVKDGVLTFTRYWKPAVGHTEHQSPQVWHERIRTTLDAAVSRQLISDRPVGVFLSGGIDSSAVLASVVRTKGTARTYTTRFEVASPTDEEKFNRDAVLARRTAEHFGTVHTEITVHRAEVIELFEQSAWHLDEPSGSATALSQLAIARTTARDVAVVLGGDGGDELFGGYERYRLSRVMDIYQQLPQTLRMSLSNWHPLLAKLDTPPDARRLALFHFMKQPLLNRVLAEPYRADPGLTSYAARFFSDTNVHFLEALMDADRQLLVDGSLLRTDKLSMAAGLEARVPLLDLEMLSLAAQIPAEQKVGLGTTKQLFKEAVRDRLPAYLFEQPKRGWFAPASLWLQQNDFHAYAKEVLSPSYYPPTSELFDWQSITSLINDHQQRVGSYRPLIWTLLSFQLWARRFQVVL